MACPFVPQCHAAMIAFQIAGVQGTKHKMQDLVPELGCPSANSWCQEGLWLHKERLQNSFTDESVMQTMPATHCTTLWLTHQS